MSRNGMLLGGLALVVAIIAIVLQFVGPSGEAGVDVSSEIAALSTDVALLKNRTASDTGARIGFINGEAAFLVFVEQVDAERQATQAKQQEIVALQQELGTGAITQEEYTERNLVLQAEALKLNLDITIATMDKMLASDGFAQLHSQLGTLRTQAEPLVTEVQNLVNTATVGVVDANQFVGRHTQLSQANEELEALVSQAASAMIAKVTEEVSVEEGMDIVFNANNTIVYRRASEIHDLTEIVRVRIAALF